MILFFLASFVILSKSYAEGGIATGGGDICEKRVQEIRDEIEVWINGNGHSELMLNGVIKDNYPKEMLKKIKATKIKCVGPGDEGFPVRVLGTPKFCLYELSETTSHIICDHTKFNNTNESDQYILIHHEFASMAGLEPPEGDISSYKISKHLSGYLEDHKKLVIKPYQKDFCSIHREKFRRFSLESRIYKEKLKMYEDLAGDAEFTAKFSRTLFALSSIILFRGNRALPRGDSMVDGLLGILFLLPVAVINSIYSTAQHLYSDSENDNYSKSVQDKVYTDNMIFEFDKALAILKAEREKVDLDWSAFSNAMTLGGIAERQTKKLYEIALLDTEIREKKVQFEKSLLLAQKCILQ